MAVFVSCWKFMFFFPDEAIADILATVDSK